jgi:GH24 family phage-related lysozyme (muramidase)
LIIIAENKNNHYLLKNFYKEISKVKLNESLRKDQAGEHTALDISALDLDFNDTIVDNPIITDQPETTVSQDDLKKAAVIKPKMNRLLKGLKRGLKISAIAAAIFFGGDNSDEEYKALKKIANDNNIEVQEVIKKTSNEIAQPLTQYSSQSSIEIDDSKNIDTALKTKVKPKEKTVPVVSSNKAKLLERAKSRIKTFEGFKPYPYKDRTGVSIGYGTFFANNIGPDSLSENWIDDLYTKCGISDEEKSQYEQESQKELLDEFSKTIESKKLKIDSIILKVENKIKTKNNELKKWSKIRNAKKRKRYTDAVKSEIERLNKRKISLEDQKSDLDLEKETAESRGLISLKLAEKCLEGYISDSIDYHSNKDSIFGDYFFKMDEDVQDVIIDMSYNVGMYFLEEEFPNFEGFIIEYISSIKNSNNKEKIKALKKMYEEIKDNSPKYHKQQSSNKRAEKNTELLKKAYEKAKNNLKENVYSLKAAYKILFS